MGRPIRRCSATKRGSGRNGSNIGSTFSYAVDGGGIGTNTAQVRAERCGTRLSPGNGRVYHIFFRSPALNCAGEVRQRSRCSQADLCTMMLVSSMRIETSVIERTEVCRNCVA